MILDINSVCAKMDPTLSQFIHNVITTIKIAVPVILIIFGMLDLAKGVAAGKEDEIKKGQNTFIKRLIAGVIVFFMIALTQLVISLIDKESNGGFWACANKIMNGTAGEQLTESGVKEQRNIIIRECCTKVNGEIFTNDEGASTCKVPQGKQSVYNECFNNKINK